MNKRFALWFFLISTIVIGGVWCFHNLLEEHTLNDDCEICSILISCQSNSDPDLSSILRLLEEKGLIPVAKFKIQYSYQISDITSRSPPLI